ncbi:MAG: phenylalanine--tRNA ligase beta subunit-related protein [Fimbriimonadaceae bacterium]|nr:phenylalanine--tRNA ligase beta subunit-related protein [Fimbriimonadaceae bacterium]
MKVPISMLREYVDTTLEASPLAHLFTMAGFEVESVEEVEGEPVLDVNIMANRGDGLSILGLAREVAAKDPAARRTPLFDRLSGLAARSSNEGSGSAKFSIDILTEHCSRYAAGLFEINAVPTPPMIQRRLLQMGMRPISLIVDLTNYVMLELGQPLHAFDFDKVRDGKIVVRQAREGEVLVTLDGVERKLNPEMMMICDSERPIALAGVMGGLETEFSGSTQRVLLESAHFNYRSVRRTRRSLGMSTEASYRFERGLIPKAWCGRSCGSRSYWKRPAGDDFPAVWWTSTQALRSARQSSFA